MWEERTAATCSQDQTDRQNQGAKYSIKKQKHLTNQKSLDLGKQTVSFPKSPTAAVSNKSVRFLTHQPPAACCHLEAGSAGQTDGSTNSENSTGKKKMQLKTSPIKRLFGVKLHFTCAHMRMISVFVLSQSIKTLTTCIRPWLVRISSFSRKLFSLWTDLVLCWLPSESESRSSEKNKTKTDRVKEMNLFLNKKKQGICRF